jgi:hypothetical protein
MKSNSENLELCRELVVCIGSREKFELKTENNRLKKENDSQA